MNWRKNMENSAEQLLDPHFTDLIEKRSQRPEVGAMWEKKSRKNDTVYYTMRIKLTKEQLLDLTQQIEEGEEVAQLDMVTFPTRKPESNNRKPSHRIYQEMR